MIMSSFVNGVECLISHILLTVACIFSDGVHKIVFVAGTDFLLLLRTDISAIRAVAGAVSSWRTCSTFDLERKGRIVAWVFVR